MRIAEERPDAPRAEWLGLTAKQVDDAFGERVLFLHRALWPSNLLGATRPTLETQLDGAWRAFVGARDAFETLTGRVAPADLGLFLPRPGSERLRVASLRPGDDRLAIVVAPFTRTEPSWWASGGGRFTGADVVAQ